MYSQRASPPCLVGYPLDESTQTLEGVSNEWNHSLVSSTHGSIRTPSSETSEAQQARWDQEDREAEELFSKQVETLCQNLWPPKSIKQRFSMSQTATRLHRNRLFQPFVPAPQQALIERLKGAGLNHITCITLPSSYPKEELDLILRVPRWNQKRLDRDVAALDFVRRAASIPVPKIAATDLSCNNPFDKPYVLQHRLPGCDLNTVWDDLNHSQRCIIAIEMGRIIRTFLTMKSEVTGLIEPLPAGSEDSKQFQIAPSELDIDLDELPEETREKILNVPRTRQTTLDVIKSQFERCRLVSLAHNCGEVDNEVELWDSMLKAVQEMDDLHLFEPGHHCLCHVDLHPGNIMVKVPSITSIEISAILDWDEAVFAPRFVKCHPPGWIWGYEDMDRVDEHDLLP